MAGGVVDAPRLSRLPAQQRAGVHNRIAVACGSRPFTPIE